VRVTPRSREVWRAWLERNHARRAEVWLVFYKRHTGKPSVSYGDAVEEALCFGWIDGLKRSIDEARYEHRFTPRRPGSKWSALNEARARQMIAADRMTAAGFRAIEDAKRRGQWSTAMKGPEVDLSMPEALTAALKRNEEAAAFFDTLAPSHRKAYIAWIVAARRPETRTRRLAEAIELLGRGAKLGMR